MSLEVSPPIVLDSSNFLTVHHIALMGFDLGTAKLILEIVAWLARFLARVQGPTTERLKDLEAEILHYLAERKEWTTPGLIWADLVLLPILKDVRFDEAFPPATRGWLLFKWRVKNFRVNLRHRWRMWRHFVPEAVVENITRHLWREGKLRRAWWDELYQIKYD